jgi:hypothetical protein
LPEIPAENLLEKFDACFRIISRDLEMNYPVAHNFYVEMISNLTLIFLFRYVAVQSYQPPAAQKRV